MRSPSSAAASSYYKECLLNVVSNNKFLVIVLGLALVAGMGLQELVQVSSQSSSSSSQSSSLPSRNLGAPSIAYKAAAAVSVPSEILREGGRDNAIAAAAAAATATALQTAPDTSLEQSLATTQTQLQKMGLEPLYNPQTIKNDPWKAELFQRLDRVRVVCGTLCQLNTVDALSQHLVTVPGAAIAMARVNDVNCPALFSSSDIDAGDNTTPTIPHELVPYYTFDNVVKITSHKLRRDIAMGKAVTRIWTQAAIDTAIQQAKEGTLVGTYGLASTTLLRNDIGDKLSSRIRGASILVIGSQTPWIEAILLHFGAAHVTTLEYSVIRSEHDQISTLQPFEFRNRYMDGTLQPFDGVVTHSSIEHSGLGRYGDALNPWGDILAVARAWCVTKDDGFLYLGLPTGKDVILSNWHRTYGTLRWPLVAANWKPMPTKSKTTSSELTRGPWQACAHGGHAYTLTKQSIASTKE